MSPHRSIPAPTGKPTSASTGSYLARVYPRAYGEAAQAIEARQMKVGLSPRLRGSPYIVELALDRIGSIPAPTGKPPVPRGASFLDRVYPRAYGEASAIKSCSGMIPGLSPRLRGSQQGQEDSGTSLRSIPAPTGKPAQRAAHRVLPQVYPRAYGEALITSGMG